MANESTVKEKKPNIFKRIGKYFRDLKGETKKIVWPTKKQVLNNTIVVLITMLIVGLVIWGLDWVFNALVALLLQQA
ncbi:MAG TPA: preprotein translocase subunit SecE [Firmicutes bacterium]|nr:preprotein translocase subunit SecE [Bacillota bacterium]